MLKSKKIICKKCNQEVKLSKEKNNVVYECNCGKSKDHLPCYTDEQYLEITNNLEKSKKTLEEIVDTIKNYYSAKDVLVTIQNMKNNIKCGEPEIITAKDLEMSDPYIGLTKDSLKFYILDNSQGYEKLIKVKDKVITFINRNDIVIYVDSSIEITIKKDLVW